MRIRWSTFRPIPTRLDRPLAVPDARPAMAEGPACTFAQPTFTTLCPPPPQCAMCLLFICPSGRGGGEGRAGAAPAAAAADEVMGRHAHSHEATRTAPTAQRRPAALRGGKAGAP